MSEENKEALRVATSVVDEGTRNVSAWKKSKAQRMLPKSGKGLMLSGDARVSRSGPFWSTISTLEGCRRRRTLSLRPSLGQAKQSTSLRKWQGIELKRRLDVKLLGWTIQLPSMVTSPWRSWRRLSVVWDQPARLQGKIPSPITWSAGSQSRW